MDSYSLVQSVIQMKTYVIWTGSPYTLEQETPTKLLVTTAVADRDISFDFSELKEINAATQVLTFHVGNRKYHVNRNYVSILN